MHPGARLLVLDADVVVFRVGAIPGEAGGVALGAFEHLRVHELIALRTRERLHLGLTALGTHAFTGGQRRGRINRRRSLAACPERSRGSRRALTACTTAASRT